MAGITMWSLVTPSTVAGMTNWSLVTPRRGRNDHLVVCDTSSCLECHQWLWGSARCFSSLSTESRSSYTIPRRSEPRTSFSSYVHHVVICCYEHPNLEPPNLRTTAVDNRPSTYLRHGAARESSDLRHRNATHGFNQQATFDRSTGA